MKGTVMYYGWNLLYGIYIPPLDGGMY